MCYIQNSIYSLNIDKIIYIMRIYNIILISKIKLVTELRKYINKFHFFPKLNLSNVIFLVNMWHYEY